MTLPTPPRYAVIPQEIGDQAYALDKPKRALFADFQRILSLAWQSNYQKTPALNEQELWEWLKLSRRQYFDKKAEMEAMGWLRSSHPRTGCVQFDFSRSFSSPTPVPSPTPSDLERGDGESAKNRTEVRKTAPDLSTEEEESIKDSEVIKPSSSSNEPEKVRKTAPASKDRKFIVLMISNLHLVFDPFKHGVLEMRNEFRELQPDHVLGCIAKVFQDLERLERRKVDPIGTLVNLLRSGEALSPFFVDNVQEILPESFLEKIGRLELRCTICEGDPVFRTQVGFDEHMKAEHPEPEIADEDLEEEIEAIVVAASVREPINGSLNAEQAWMSVLGQLQMEMPRASFDTWVRDTRVVRFDSNTLFVSVRNAYARDWLENRLTSTVNRLLIGILNSGDIHVQFVVHVPEVANAQA